RLAKRICGPKPATSPGPKMSGTASRNIGSWTCNASSAPIAPSPTRNRNVTDDLLLRRILVSFSGLVYWVGVVIQARRIRRHIGRSPNLKPRGLKERLLWAGWFIVILA